jgi:transcriptional regulator
MYVPSLYAEAPERIADHVRTWPFATVFTQGELGPYATHLPLVLTSPTRLVGHLARANPHHQDFGGPVLAVFHGPHALVRSDWYGEPEKHVPTWNYLAVHATGTIRILPDPVEALDLAMSTFQAPERVPTGREERDQFLMALSRAIVAFEIEVSRWEGKAKLSQNRSPEDQQRVREQLAASTEPLDRAIAQEMRKR